MESSERRQRPRHHFVLVHGVCHGAWSWYKVATFLSLAGHRVTALDMAACGASPGRAEDVPSFENYSRPLFDAVAGLPPDEKAVLVGHSFGGQSLALAMERYPDKIAVSVFVAATMPTAGKPMNLVYEQHPVGMFLFGPQYMEKILYQLSPPEDLTLAMAMVKRSRRYREDETLNGAVLTAERYGVVRRVCIVAEDDASYPADSRRLLASWNPGAEVKGLQGADHMPMFSKPRELSELLIEIAHKYT